MKKTLAILAFLTICSVSYGGEPLLEVSRLDSLPEIIQYYLTETTSKHFEDPKVPRFLMKDRTDNFVFGVGGSVQAKMFYDHLGNKGNYFSMSKDSGTPATENDVIDFNLNSTSLVFKVLGKTKIGVVDALVSIDFNNSTGGVRLTQAYVDLFGMRIGLTNTAFRDDVSMDLVDFNGVVTSTVRKVPQVSYSYRFKNGLRAQAGIEFPQSTSVSVINEDGTTGITKYNILLPDLNANVFYTGERIHLYGGVAGRLMNYYKDNVEYKGIPSYAFQVSMNWAFVKRPEQTHKLFAQGIWTHGMADCCISMRNKGLSAVTNFIDSSYSIPNVWGGSVGYQAKFGKNTIDMAGSINSAYGIKDAGIPGMYEWGYAFVVNYFRTFIKYGTAGVEVVSARRNNIDATTSFNSRVYLYLRYNF